jgi:uncharacterized repeat protein (TIGR01451 family)
MRGNFAKLVSQALLASLMSFAAGTRVEAQEARPAQGALEVRQQMPGSVTPGQPAAIVIVVRNSGLDAAENVVVAARLPASCELLDAEPTPERLPGSLRWTLGAIPSQAQRVVHYRLTTPAAGLSGNELRSTVKVTYQASVSDTTVAVVQRPTLTLKVKEPESAAVGEPAAVVVSVANSGTTTAENVTLQTLLPTGLTHPGGNDLETDVGTLRPGETRQITLAVTPTRPGQFRHSVRALIGGASTAEQEISLVAQDLKLSLAAHGPHLLYPDWTGSFEVVVRNEDTRPINRIAVAVRLPAGLSVARANESGTVVDKDQLLRWQLNTLAPGESRTLIWNGVARTVGEHVWAVQVWAGERAGKAVTGRTTVLAAPEGSAPVAQPETPASPPAARAVSVSSGKSLQTAQVHWRPVGAVPATPTIPFELHEPGGEPALPGTFAIGWRSDRAN